MAMTVQEIQELEQHLFEALMERSNGKFTERKLARIASEFVSEKALANESMCQKGVPNIANEIIAYLMRNQS